MLCLQIIDAFVQLSLYFLNSADSPFPFANFFHISVLLLLVAALAAEFFLAMQQYFNLQFSKKTLRVDNFVGLKVCWLTRRQPTIRMYILVSIVVWKKWFCQPTSKKKFCLLLDPLKSQRKKKVLCTTMHYFIALFYNDDDGWSLNIDCIMHEIIYSPRITSDKFCIASNFKCYACK